MINDRRYSRDHAPCVAGSGAFDDNTPPMAHQPSGSQWELHEGQPVVKAGSRMAHATQDHNRHSQHNTNKNVKITQSALDSHLHLLHNASFQTTPLPASGRRTRSKLQLEWRTQCSAIAAQQRWTRLLCCLWWMGCWCNKYNDLEHKSLRFANANGAVHSQEVMA